MNIKGSLPLIHHRCVAISELWGWPARWMLHIHAPPPQSLRNVRWPDTPSTGFSSLQASSITWMNINLLKQDFMKWQDMHSCLRSGLCIGMQLCRYIKCFKRY
jgi:hypothetical protein